MNFKVVPVPPKMEKFFGKGKMLHPREEQVIDWLKKIPAGEYCTLQTLGEKLAKEAGTNVCCPMRLGNIIKNISNQSNPDGFDLDLPFWRVVRKDMRLIKSTHQAFWGSLLTNEGHTLQTNAKGELFIVA